MRKSGRVSLSTLNVWMFGSRTTVKKVRNSLTWFSQVLASLVLSYSLSSSTSEPGGLLSSPQRVRTASLVAGSFARPPSPCAPFPVSPLPCLRSDTVWLVLWLVTALQGPCQWFVLRESAGLALFRSLTVPCWALCLLAADVSPCSRPWRAFCGSLLSLAVLAGLLPQLITYDHCFTFVDFHFFV